MLVRDKKTGRFLSQKKSNGMLTEKKKKVVDKGKKSYILPMMVLCGIILTLAIAYFVK